MDWFIYDIYNYEVKYLAQRGGRCGRTKPSGCYRLEFSSTSDLPS